MQSENILFLDIETTGLVPKGATYEADFLLFPHVVQLSWIVGEIEKDFIIRPEGWIIPAEATEIHGITQEIANEKGRRLIDVLEELIIDAKECPKIIGHNIYFDISIIKANALKLGLVAALQDHINPALDKTKRIDTMMKTIKFCGLKQEGSNRAKFPSLVDLYFKLFAEEFPAHNSMEDCRAMKRCLPELVKLGIIEL